jgi:septal ring factor EnvC (AmiA/AmiB activator)
LAISLFTKKNYFLLLLLWLLSSGSAFAVDSVAELDKSREQLAGLEQRLEKTLAELAQNETVESNLLDELDLVDRQLAKLRRQVGAEKKKLKELTRSISKEQSALTQNSEAVAQLQIQVQKRLVAMYKSEQAGVLKTLFSAQNISRLLEDYDYLGRVVVQDRKLLDDFRQRVNRKKLSLDRLSAGRKKQQRVTAELKIKEDSLKQTVRLKNRYLASIRNDHAALDRIAIDLKARAERLTGLVADLESEVTGEKKGGGTLFALQKGFLPWPIQGAVKNSFGSYKHAELGTLLDNHGIDIFADPDTEVKAVWGGRVAFANKFRGYGNLVIIDHENGYYTLYAQVQNVLKKTDDRVEKGDSIASSGFDGADHVYFEVRKGRTPLNPLLWIEKR